MSRTEADDTVGFSFSAYARENVATRSGAIGAHALAAPTVIELNRRAHDVCDLLESEHLLSPIARQYPAPIAAHHPTACVSRVYADYPRRELVLECTNSDDHYETVRFELDELQEMGDAWSGRVLADARAACAKRAFAPRENRKWRPQRAARVAAV